MNRWPLCCIFLFFSFQFVLQAQPLRVKVIGKIFDAESKIPLPGVYISINNNNNASDVIKLASNQNGSFSVAGLNPGSNYTLYTSILGYNTLALPIYTQQEDMDLGNIYLTVKSQSISEVIVKADMPSAVQKGDTIEVNASAFKTMPNASAEELVTKMPGIIVENGTIKAQGEEVKKVMVDGKDFFGEDPALALKNLPAEVVDKIQVFDKLSEQAQFTGFDDGNSIKTINIITKPSKQKGEFGKLYAGTDFQSKYIAGGNLNLFQHKRRISILGLLNNINQQNFTQQDLQGIASLTNTGKHDGGFIIGQQNGINTTRSLGVNYSDNWGEKISVTASYFFNSTQNYTTDSMKKDKFLFPRPDHYSNEIDTISSRKNNHRFNVRIEYTIDSANTLILVPKFSIVDNNSRKFMAKLTTKNSGVFVNEEKLRSNTETDGFDLENELVFRHKFSKPKRTLTYSLTTSTSNKDQKYPQTGFLRKNLTDTITEDQYVKSNTNAYKVTSNLVYIEPLSNLSMLHFNFTNAYTNSKKSRDDYELDKTTNTLAYSDSLSNIYKTNFFSNHLGVAYRIKSDKLKLSLGMEYQYAILNGDQSYPLNANVRKIFTNYLPNFQLTYKFTNKNTLKILYNTSTDSPNISQLQNAIDNSDKTNLSTGNPGLKQEYTNTVKANYSFANPDRSISYSLIFLGEYTVNYIGNQTITAQQDTSVAIQNTIIPLSKNMQLSFPVNLDYYRGGKLIFNYSFPLRFIQSKLNLFTGVNYAQTPAYINETLNRYTLYSTSNGFVLSSNVSQNIDFTISYTANYSIVKNSIITSNSYVYPKYLYQSLGIKSNIIVWKGIVIQNDVVDQYDKGFQNFNKNFVLWNAGIGKKLFKNQNGEIKLGVFDLLNQNVNIAHTVTPQYIRDSKYNTLNRYFLLTFTFDFNSVPDQGGDMGGSKKEKKSGHKKNN